MSAAASLMHSVRRLPSRWVWVVVALLVWKAALPWLAATVAQHHGVATAEVCSVYGIRTVSLAGTTLTSSATDGARVSTSVVNVINMAEPLPLPEGQVSHTNPDHCALGVLVGAVLTPSSLAEVVLHAPAQTVVSLRQPQARRHPDAVQRWISSHTLAPPLA